MLFTLFKDLFIPVFIFGGGQRAVKWLFNNFQIVSHPTGQLARDSIVIRLRVELNLTYF